MKSDALWLRVDVHGSLWINRNGQPLETGEALSPEQALALFTSPAHDPGAPPRRIEVGAPDPLGIPPTPKDRTDAAVFRHRSDVRARPK